MGEAGGRNLVEAEALAQVGKLGVTLGRLRLWWLLQHASSLWADQSREQHTSQGLGSAKFEAEG